MAQLESFLFELSFGDIKKIRDYMLKRYHVYCGSTLLPGAHITIKHYSYGKELLQE